MPNGAKYFGAFDSNKLYTGQGIYFYENGDIYDVKTNKHE